MCTFNGIIEDIPEITVDMFGESHLDKERFFLTHCHTDHMHGLSDPEFLNHMKKTDSFIYCSIISSKILENLYKEIQNKIVPLSMGSHIFEFKKENPIEVILIPAGHCPGSVMFLFKTKEKNILFTGDISIPSDQLCKIPSFFDKNKNLINFDLVYFDNTFMDLKYLTFPSRDKSIDMVLQIFDEWLKDSNCLIHLEPSAKFGAECFYKPIYLTFGMPIYVNSNLIDTFKLIPDISRYLTNDKKSTRIFICRKGLIQSICKEKRNCYANKLKLCALSFTNLKHENKDLASFTQQNVRNTDIYKIFYKVLFPTHLSCSEIVKFLNFLDAKKIEPLVVKPTQTKQKILAFYHSIKNEEQFYIDRPASLKKQNFSGIIQEKKRKKIENDFVYKFPKRNLSFDPEEILNSYRDFFN